MSRIGIQHIKIPAGVEVNVSNQNLVTVKGKAGQLEQQVAPDIEVKIEEGAVVLNRRNEARNTRAMHGLYRSLINNMVEGITNGYKIELELIGVGYRADVQNGVLDLTLGFSHHIFFQLPEPVKAEAVSERGKNPRIILTSIDKQLIGQVAAKIRA